MARKLTIERQRVGALSEADYWTLSVGPSQAPSSAELRRLHAVWLAHPDGGYHGAPHCWGWWAFESGHPGGGHAFTTQGNVQAWLWLEGHNQLTAAETTWLADARQARAEREAELPQWYDPATVAEELAAIQRTWGNSPQKET